MAVAARARQLAATASAVVAMMGFAACGAESHDSNASTAAQEGTGSTADASAGSATAQAFPRTVTHHKGETTLEARPERIVALDNSLVEAVLALGGNVVGGICSYRDVTTCPPYLGRAGEEIDDVGPLESPNLEAIAALRPDLIVSATVRHEALYDELARIAPTIFVETTGPTWKDNIRLMGEALGAENRADERLTAYEQRAAVLGAEINAKAGNPKLSIVRFLDGPTRLYANKSFSGIVLADMGLARPKAQDIEDFAVEIGEEEIRKADGDHIFVTVYSKGEENKERFERNPLWRSLSGVKAGNVHEVEDAIWMTSVSLQGAELMMDDMARIFAVDPHKS